MSKPNGGMAFPMTAGPKDAYGNLSHPHQWGMTLRDYFAGQVLAGLVTYRGLDQVLTEDAYRVADAMIAERGK